jgi:hypothetical protein
MTNIDLSLGIVVTAIWGLNFSVIKIGLISFDPYLLAAIRFASCAVPAFLFVPKPKVAWRYLVAYGLVFGAFLWGLVYAWHVGWGDIAGLAVLGFFYHHHRRTVFPGKNLDVSNCRDCRRISRLGPDLFHHRWFNHIIRSPPGGMRGHSLKRGKPDREKIRNEGNGGFYCLVQLLFSAAAVAHNTIFECLGKNCGYRGS